MPCNCPSQSCILEGGGNGVMNPFYFSLHCKFSSFSLPNSLILSFPARVKASNFSNHFLRALSQYASTAPSMVLTASHTVPYCSGQFSQQVSIYMHPDLVVFYHLQEMQNLIDFSCYVFSIFSHRSKWIS